MDGADWPLSAIELTQFGDEDGEFPEGHVIVRCPACHLTDAVNQLPNYTHIMYAHTRRQTTVNTWSSFIVYL